MNDVSDHEATMQLLYGYVVRKNILRPCYLQRYYGYDCNLAIR